MNQMMIKSTLVQEKTGCFMLPSRYLNQCWPRAATPYVYTWGRRVQKSKWNKRHDIYAILIFWNIDFSNSIHNLVRCRRQRQTNDHYFCFVWFGVIYIIFFIHISIMWHPSFIENYIICQKMSYITYPWNLFRDLLSVYTIFSRHVC